VEEWAGATDVIAYSKSSRLATTVDYDNYKKSRLRDEELRSRRGWARPGKEGKSGEPTWAGGVAGRSRAFRWAESDAELTTLTSPGCQGTTTRSTPDPDKRPSDVGTEWRWMPLRQKSAAPRCRCGRWDWDGAIERRLEAVSMHTNVDLRRF
jgi:hypothetical protein